jgi:hypothetical protein
MGEMIMTYYKWVSGQGNMFLDLELHQGYTKQAGTRANPLKLFIYKSAIDFFDMLDYYTTSNFTR